MHNGGFGKRACAGGGGKLKKMQEIIIKADSTCAACFEETSCFRSDCLCHDLNMCTPCWHQWVTTNDYESYEVVDNNNQEKTNLMLCPKCQTKAFDASLDANANYVAAFTWLVFGGIGLALVVFANVSVLEQGNAERHEKTLVFVALIDFFCAVLVVLLLQQAKKHRFRVFREEDVTMTLTSASGILYDVPVSSVYK